MKILQYATTLLLPLCLTGCRYSDTAIGDIAILDVAAAVDNKKTFDLADISNGIDFIALDGTSEESLLSGIKRMQESKNGFYYIMDLGTKPVKVFDRTGTFLFTRGYIGRGPNEFFGINDIAVDYRKDIVYLSGYGERIVSYDADGNVFARTDSASYGRIACHNDQLILLRRSPTFHEPTPDPDRIITIADIFSPDLCHEGKIDAFYRGAADIVVTSPRIFSAAIAQDVLSDNGENLLIKEGRCDTVFYYMNDMTVEPAYYLDMGDYAFPAAALGYDPPETANNKSYLIMDIIEGARYILVDARGSHNQPNSTLIFDRQNLSDGFTAVGPDGEQGLFLGEIEFTPMYVRDNRLVGYMQALDIVDNAASITDPDLRVLAAALKEDSNPVIVVATLEKR